MLNRTLILACLFAALAACERTPEPMGDARASEPEHFDRARAEQLEKEEDRLHRRVSRN